MITISVMTPRAMTVTATGILAMPIAPALTIAVATGPARPGASSGPVIPGPGRSQPADPDPETQSDADEPQQLDCDVPKGHSRGRNYWSAELARVIALPGQGRRAASRRVRFALWKGRRVVVGRSFRNANQIEVRGRIIDLRARASERNSIVHRR